MNLFVSNNYKICVKYYSEWAATATEIETEGTMKWRSLETSKVTTSISKDSKRMPSSNASKTSATDSAVREEDWEVEAVANVKTSTLDFFKSWTMNSYPFTTFQKSDPTRSSRLSLSTADSASSTVSSTATDCHPCWGKTRIWEFPFDMWKTLSRKSKFSS